MAGSRSSNDGTGPSKGVVSARHKAVGVMETKRTLSARFASTTPLQTAGSSRPRD